MLTNIVWILMQMLRDGGGVGSLGVSIVTVLGSLAFFFDIWLFYLLIIYLLKEVHKER